TLANVEAGDTLSFGATDIDLNTNGATVAGSFTYTVSSAGASPVVTITHAGADDATVNTLLDSATFNNSTNNDPSTTAKTVTLTSVTDSGSGTTADGTVATVTITAVDDAPTASAGPDQNATENTSVSLDATGSSDLENQSLTYTWTQTAGPSVTLSDANATQPTFTTPKAAADYTLTFQVAVNDGTTTTYDTVNVEVVHQNLAPIADAGSNLYLSAGGRGSLSGMSSADADDQELTYRWTQVSGTTLPLSGSTTPNPTFQIPSDASGSAVFQLVVSDGKLSATDSVTVYIAAQSSEALPVDAPPAPSAPPSPEATNEPEPEPAN
ncbi:MAG: hypothetical protein GY708_18480, partial [Actinomycetia bacterium]|nr:hypothetical protein [Actinomycetes bacterium]